MSPSTAPPQPSACLSSRHQASSSFSARPSFSTTVTSLPPRPLRSMRTTARATLGPAGAAAVSRRASPGGGEPRKASSASQGPFFTTVQAYIVCARPREPPPMHIAVNRARRSRLYVTLPTGGTMIRAFALFSLTILAACDHSHAAPAPPPPGVWVAGQPEDPYGDARGRE